MFIATLIAKDELRRGDISAAADALRQSGLDPGAAEWIDEGSACDLAFTGDPAEARSALEALGRDVVVQPSAGRRRAMLVADMDSTMIDVECIDELADYAGIKAEVAAVTERAMRHREPLPSTIVIAWFSLVMVLVGAGLVILLL